MFNNETNQTIDLKNLLLEHFRVTWLESILYLCLIVPMGILGTLFNAISFLIFLKKSFRNKALFKYMQVYTFNSLIITSCQIFFFYYSTYHLFDLATSYGAKIFKCYITPSYVMAFCYFYGNVLDVFINIERALNFSDKYEKFRRVSPYLVCLTVFIVSLIINTPNIFLFNMVSDKEVSVKLKLCVSSSFTESLKGKIILLICYIVEGPVILFLVIITSIFSMKTFRSYLNDKSNSLKVNNQLMNKIKIKKQKTIDKLDRKLIFLTLCLSGLSIVFHIVQFTSQLIIFLSNYNAKFTSIFVFLYVLTCSLKHFSNIFVYCYFSAKFRKTLFCQTKKKYNKHRQINPSLINNQATKF